MADLDDVPQDVLDEFEASLDKDIQTWRRAFDKHVREYEGQNPLGKYGPTQPRDRAGRWTDGGSSDSILDAVMDAVDLGDEDADHSDAARASAAWQARLNPREQSALRRYRDAGGFERMNEYLRGESMGSAGTREAAGYLQGALDKSTVAPGTKVFRGVRFEGSDGAEFLANVKPGSTIRDGGFISGSPSSTIAGKFAVPQGARGTGVLFDLTVGRAKGAYIAQAGREPEYLFQAGSSIKVKSVERRADGFALVRGTIET